MTPLAERTGRPWAAVCVAEVLAGRPADEGMGRPPIAGGSSAVTGGPLPGAGRRRWRLPPSSSVLLGSPGRGRSRWRFAPSSVPARSVLLPSDRSVSDLSSDRRGPPRRRTGAGEPCSPARTAAGRVEVSAAGSPWTPARSDRAGGVYRASRWCWWWATARRPHRMAPERRENDAVDNGLRCSTSSGV